VKRRGDRTARVSGGRDKNIQQRISRRAQALETRGEKSRTEIFERGRWPMEELEDRQILTRRRAPYGHHGGWETEGLGDNVGQTWGKTITGGEWRYELHPHRWQREFLRKLLGILPWPLLRDVQPAIGCKTTQ
jgi:hypothetical protein